MLQHRFKIEYNDPQFNKQTFTIEASANTLVIDVRDQIAKRMCILPELVLMKTGVPPKPFYWTDQSIVSDIFQEKRTRLIIQKSTCNCVYLHVPKAQTASNIAWESPEETESMDLDSVEVEWSSMEMEVKDEGLLYDEEIFDDTFHNNRMTEKRLDKSPYLEEIERLENMQCKFLKGTEAESSNTKVYIASEMHKLSEKRTSLNGRSTAEKQLLELLQKWHDLLTKMEINNQNGINSIHWIITEFVGPQEWEKSLNQQQKFWVHIDKIIFEKEQQYPPVELVKNTYMDRFALEMASTIIGSGKFKKISSEGMSFLDFVKVMHPIIFDGLERPVTGCDLLDRAMLQFLKDFNIIDPKLEFNVHVFYKKTTLQKSLV